MSLTVKEMMKACERLVAEGKGDLILYSIESASGVSGYVNAPYIHTKEECYVEAGPMEELSGDQEVVIVSIDF